MKRIPGFNKYSGEYTQTELAQLFLIPFPTVHVIVRHKQWRHI
jgi:hypothetical protein